MALSGVTPSYPRAVEATSATTQGGYAMKSYVRLWFVIALALVPLWQGGGAVAQDDAQPLKIGALLPFSGDLSDFGQPMFNGVELAVNEINEAGGVNGMPIELVRGDSATSPQQSVEEARRLVEVEGVNAIIGPAGSGSTLQVVEAVTGPSSILHFSASATSPALTIANDNDFFFRTTISDAAQGVVLADLAVEEGYTSACTMYVNNAYGQGLSDVFTTAFEERGGTVTAQVPHEQEQASYASELSACTEGEPDVLVAISYPESLRVYVREALEAGTVTNFLFSDGGRSPEAFAELGWDYFQDMYGTSAGAPETEAGTAFDAAYQDAYGDPPSIPYLRESYDAVYLIALAAELAGSTDPAEMRDALRDVSNEPGEVVNPGPEGWESAVSLIADGQDIDYQGAAGSLDFDDAGDVVIGTIITWQIQGEDIVVVRTEEIDLRAEAGAATPAS